MLFLGPRTAARAVEDAASEGLAVTHDAEIFAIEVASQGLDSSLGAAMTIDGRIRDTSASTRNWRVKWAA
jgi:hypothetical protein